MKFDVAIIGAGIVGASVALWVQQDGKKTLLLDGQPPGSATSSGNAGTIATYACVPVNSPEIFRRLPKLLFSRDSPLRIDWQYALSHLPWHVAFLRNCTTSRVNVISSHLAKLLELTQVGLDPLVKRSGAEQCFADKEGIYYVFSSAAAYRAAQRETEARRRYGASVTELSGQEFKQREPGVTMPIHRALLFEGARFLHNPKRLVERYVDQFVRDGGTFKQQQVLTVTPDSGDIEVRLEDKTSIRCGKLVIAAGAWSGNIPGSGTEELPLDTERGYHIMFGNHGNRLRRPVAWVEGGFYATPMEQGLRLAGTVELAGLKNKPNQNRIDYLIRSAHTMFAGLGQPDDTWLGFRPTFPDALPVIGPSPRSPHILFAFGHQHVGLTLGGVTGKLIADLVAERKPPIDLNPYSATRFGRRRYLEVP